MKPELAIGLTEEVLPVAKLFTQSLYKPYAIIKLPLNKGTYWLEFVSLENKEDKFAREYIIAGPFYHVNSVMYKNKAFVYAHTRFIKNRFIYLDI
jgi:hypothetical protein